ncbi:MAG: hypothetical protein ABMA02_18105 [Saprospiraceae bacterium]
MKRISALLLLLFCFVSLWSQNPVVCITNQDPGANKCADACLHCILDNRTGSTAGYTSGPAPGFCGSVENNQWFGFVAGSGIAVSVKPTNCQSGNGIEIALYANCTDEPIVCAAGQPGGGDETRSLTAGLIPGQTYFLMVDGYNGDQCSFQITTNAGAVAQPPVATPAAIEGPKVVAPFSALRYSIPPIPNATAYRWEAPIGSLVNDQTPPVTLPAPSGNQVTVTFGNQEGQVCVAPVNLCDQGKSCLSIAIGSDFLAPPCNSNSDPAADLCADACVFCDFNIYTGTTAGYTGQTPPGFCSGAQNEQWIGFVAGKKSATFTITPSNCQEANGVQVALYSSCTAIGPIDCNAGQQGGGATPISVSASSLVPGENYYLVIDGYGGDICDFLVSVTPPDAMVAAPVGPTGPISGPLAACPGGTFNYSVAPVLNAGSYIWSGPPGSKINGFSTPAVLSGAGGNVVQVTFGAGLGQICVQPTNSCYDGVEICKQVNLNNLPVTNLPPVTICNEDAPYYTPWGIPCPNPGVYCTTYTTEQGCDSVVCIRVNIRAPIVFVYAPKVLCAGESVTICGEAFSAVGNHSKVCESYLGCDSTVYQTIVAILDPVAEIATDQDPLCAKVPLLLSSAVTSGVKTWSTLTGQALGMDNSIAVTDPGTYILTAVATANGTTCTTADTVQVAFGVPEVVATGGLITCIQPTVQVTAATNQPGVLFSWSGPNGYVSDQQAPVVDKPGEYTVTVTDPTSGCTAQAVALVLTDALPPQVSLPPLELNCTVPDVALGCPPIPGLAGCLWSGPGIPVPVPNPVVAQAGVYLLTITYLNGCTATAEMSISADFQVPVITAYADTITCLNTTTTVHCDVDIPNSTCICMDSPIGLCFMVIATAPNGCTATATVMVPIDIDIPDVSVEPADVLTCSVPTTVLHGSSSTPGVVFLWTGPNGFSSGSPDPQVNTPGTYTLIVTNPANGCTSVASVVVLSDIPDLGVKATASGPLTCANETVQLISSTTASNANFVWTGPGIVVPGINPIVNQPGVYTLLVTELTTGCTGTAQVEVVQDLYAVVLAVEGGVLTCDSPAAVVDLPQVPGFEPMTFSLPGVYTLNVTNPGNGCISTVTITVLEDKSPPEIALVQVAHDLNGQGIGAVSIAVTNAGAYTVAWYLNGQFFSNVEDISGLVTGVYMVVVTGANGCTNSLSVTVPDFGFSAPEASSDSQWLVFPNPASNLLYLRYLGPDRPEAAVFLLDATGRVVLERRIQVLPDNVLPCEQLPTGIYTMLVQTKEAVVRCLVAIQR